MWFSNAHIVDVTSGEIHQNRHFEIVDGIITQIQLDAPPVSAKSTDLNGQFVLPGIISCHTHLMGSSRKVSATLHLSVWYFASVLPV